MGQIHNFLTNDGIAMALAACTGFDWPWLIALALGCLLNTWLYIVVCYLAWSARRGIDHEKTPVANAFMSLMYVFALCGIAGYFLEVVHVFYPVYKIKALVMAPLIIWTVRLVMAIKKTGTLHKMFTMENTIRQLQAEAREALNNVPK